VTRFALTIEFDGTPFMGLQRQPHGPSVQGSIEAAAKAVTGEEATLFSSGRTDTGVHALAMRSHIDIEKPLEPFRLMEALNAHLRPDPIAITMHRAAQALVGRHDFTTFRSAHCQAKDPVKTLDKLDVKRVDGEIHCEVAARSFLHHQVRSMVGCLKLVGQGTWDEARVAEALAAKDRQALGLNAPPHGLYFVEAIYPN